MTRRSRPIALVACPLLATIVMLTSSPAGFAVGDTPRPAAPSGRLTASDTPSDTASGAAQRQVAAVKVPRIRWQRCDESFGLFEPGPRVQCARIRVPLDYDNPDGATTRLQLTRRRAVGRSVGTLFVNPGGPGAPAASFVADGGAKRISPMVDRRMDVLGIDPRGTGGSGRATCLTRGAETIRDAVFPVTAEDEKSWLSVDDTLRRICERDPSALVDHVSTADNARDLELVRRAIKEPRISFYGVSYGSYLGATYAALFPDRIRAMIVDAVLDPVAWSTGTSANSDQPFTVRLRSGTGSYEALTSAWTECDRVGPGHCPLAPNAAQKWEQVLDAALTRPVDAFDEPQSYQDIVDLTLTGLYGRGFYKPIARVIASLHAQLEARTAPRTAAGPLRARARARSAEAADAYRLLKRHQRRLVDSGRYATPRLSGRARPASRSPKKADELFDAVICSDTANPRSPVAWPRLAPWTDRVSPWFGRLWAWSSSPCARGGVGSSADAFRGPWTTRTSSPLLIVGSVHDPATPISGARAMTTHFPGSSLLTFNGWGHGSLGQGVCMRRAMGGYLVERRLPANGSVCQPPKALFP